MKRSIEFLITLTLITLGGFSDGAPVLGLHEARVLVEHTPIFLQAARNGECPETSDSAVRGSAAWIIVRRECKGFGLIADFKVDLATGAVNRSPGEEIETAEIAQLRQQLFAIVAAAEISPLEAICLMGQIALDQTSGSCANVHIDRVTDDFIYGTAEFPCRGNEPKAIRVVTNRRTGELRNESTGEVYVSPQIEERRASLVRSHAPVRLTVEEARTLIGEPLVSNELVSRGLLSNTQCKAVELDPSNNADEQFFQMWTGCGESDESKDVIRLSVNLLDGTVRVMGTSPAVYLKGASSLGEAALATARSKKTASVEALRKECPRRP